MVEHFLSSCYSGSVPTTPLRTRAKRPVRKPIQSRSQLTRRVILRAAAQLLGQRGSASISSNAIAKRAGVSIGSFYEYFRNREELVLALLDEHLAAGEALFASRSQELTENASARPLTELLGGIVDAVLALHADDPKLHRVLSSEALRTRAVQARVQQLEQRATQLVAALLSTHPQVRVAAPLLAAQVVVQTVDSLTHRWILEPSGEPVPVQRLAAELTSMLTAYLSRLP